MAKTDNLIDYLTDIADAIREKKGITDPINAQDFADEIRNVSTEGEGSSVEPEYLLSYFDGTTDNSKLTINLTHKTARGYMGVDAVSSGFVEFINDSDIILHVPGLTKSYNPQVTVGIVCSATLEVEYSDGSYSSEELNTLMSPILYNVLMDSQSSNKFDLSIGGKKYHIEAVGY